MNIYQKINEVKKQITNFDKDKKNKHFGYGYVSGNNILSTLKPLMEGIGLVLIPINIDYKTYIAQANKKTISRDASGVNEITEISTPVIWQFDGEITYKLVNIDDPSDFILSKFAATANSQTSTAQAYGSALTYAERYFWLKTLGIPTDDLDPDAGKEPPTTTVTDDSTTGSDGGGNATKDNMVNEIMELARANKDLYNEKVAPIVKDTALDSMPVPSLAKILKLLKGN